MIKFQATKRKLQTAKDGGYILSLDITEEFNEAAQKLLTVRNNLAIVIQELDAENISA